MYFYGGKKLVSFSFRLKNLLIYANRKYNNRYHRIAFGCMYIYKCWNCLREKIRG